MASRSQATIALLMCFNLMLFSMVTAQTCPIDPTKLTTEPSIICPLISGLVDLQAAVCLCVAVRARILPTLLNLSIDLTVGVYLSLCGKSLPPGFSCSSTPPPVAPTPPPIAPPPRSPPHYT